MQRRRGASCLVGSRLKCVESFSGDPSSGTYICGWLISHIWMSVWNASSQKIHESCVWSTMTHHQHKHDHCRDDSLMSDEQRCTTHDMNETSLLITFIIMNIIVMRDAWWVQMYDSWANIITDPNHTTLGSQAMNKAMNKTITTTIRMCQMERPRPIMMTGALPILLFFLSCCDLSKTLLSVISIMTKRLKGMQRNLRLPTTLYPGHLWEIPVKRMAKRELWHG